MARKLDSPTSLTEFAPLTPDADSKVFSILNFFRRKKEKELSTSPKESQHASKESLLPTLDSDAVESKFTSSSQSLSSTSSANVDDIPNRNMSNILELVKNITEGKKMGLQSYKDSDYKQYWMPDSNCKECYECGDKFTTFRRRHHCRICGQIFCRRCCSEGIPGNLIGYSGDLRVCNYCYKMVSSCMQSFEADSEITEELQSFRNQHYDSTNIPNPQPVSLSSTQQNISISSRRKSSVMGFREEDIAKAKSMGERDKSSLDAFCWEYENKPSTSHGSTYYEHAYICNMYNQLLLPDSGLVFHKNVHKPEFQYVRGCDIVTWLLSNNTAISCSDAINIGQAFIDAELFECDSNNQKQFFNSDVLYKKKMVCLSDLQTINTSSGNHESMEPLWVKEIENNESDLPGGIIMEDANTPTEVYDSKSRSRIPSSSSSFYLDMDVTESVVKVSRPHIHTHPFSPSEFKNTPTTARITCGATCYENDMRESNLNEGLQDAFSKELLKIFNPSFLRSSQTTISAKSSSQDYHLRHQLKNENDSNDLSTLEEFNSAFETLERTLLQQLLENNELASSWCDYILPIVHAVVDTVHPDVKNDVDSMDIRQYVQFKKIPGGAKSESAIHHGVIFSKSVVHRKMLQNIVKPTVLLLSSSITYQRNENKFSSLDPVIMQEFEYLKNVIGKLTVCKPSILLVEKSVSRLAQEMLLSLGITVALNIKPSVMERVARCTQAAIVSTVDAHLSKPHLGTCDEFKVQTFVIPGGKTKTLMFLDGCEKNLGCTILLRGGSVNELKKVKQIVKFMLYVTYNWHLEQSFLLDEFATLLHLKAKIASSDCDLSVHTISSNDKEEIKTKSFSENILGNIQLLYHRNDSNMKDAIEDCEKREQLETVYVNDFSDPLHSYLQAESDEVLSDDTSFKVSDLYTCHNTSFQKLLDKVILCCSLNVNINPPYLETQLGRKCPLRKFFPDDLYWSSYFSKDKETKSRSMCVNFDEENEQLQNEVPIYSKNVYINSLHPFISYRITDISHMSFGMHCILSDYRARGGTVTYMYLQQLENKSECDKEKKLLYNHGDNSVEKDKNDKVCDGNTSAGLSWEKKVDVLDAYNHQKIAVLFCSYACSSNNAPNYCVLPWIVNMDFYGTNDIPFGGFLEKYCFRSSYVCPSSACDTKMNEHVRRFVHGSGCVHIFLHQLSSDIQSNDDNILMWNWCHKCKEASPVVPMSQDTWSFSFAKYLELRFYSSSYVRSNADFCGHSLHHDHYQYFAYKQTVAIFEFSTITVWEIVLPSMTIMVYNEMIPITSIVDEIKSIAIKGSEIYNTILEKLVAFKQQYMELHYEDVSNMMAIQKAEMGAFREKIEQIQWRLTSPTLEAMQTNTSQLSEKNMDKESCNAMWKIEDQVQSLKLHIAEAVSTWNIRIQEFVSARKKEEKLYSRTQNKVEDTCSNLISTGPTSELSTSCEEKSIKQCKCTINDVNVSYLRNPVGYHCYCEGRKHNGSMAFHSRNQKLYNKAWLERSFSCGSIKDCFRPKDIKPVLLKAYSMPIGIAYSIEGKGNNVEDVVSNTSSASSYTYGVTPGIYAGLMVPEPEDNETYVVCHKDYCNERHSGACPARGHERSKSEGHQTLSDSFSKTSPERDTNLKKDRKERSVKTFFSQLLSSSEIDLIQPPFPPSQHIFFTKVDDKNQIPVIVYDDEPSSIIAYTLASVDYEQQLQEIRTNLTLISNQRDSQTSSPVIKRHQITKQLSENLYASDNVLPTDDPNDFLDVVVCSSQETEKGSLKKFVSGGKLANCHLEIQFNDSNAQFYCRVFYAEQFRKLRCLVFNEEHFIRSLCHCIPWIARGGKSGSTFCKTRDDRFILKQMQKLELQSFLDFAPSYFHYINKAFLDQKPTLLAKILGVYRIGYRNSVTNAASKMDVLVMENLFYGRNIKCKYDLKGSVRNRFINTRESALQEDDIVLLDENLLKITCDNPLYIRPHSKYILTSAIDNDTQFLSSQSVMDYSLLVGLDEEKSELFVGIIDYIRTFTLDKKIEMLVKSSGILGGHGKMPTVVSPELYRMRFREAMDGYFSSVPDHWTNLGLGGDI